MKVNMTVITDPHNSRFLGAIRSDPVTIGKQTIQPIFRKRADQAHHQVQVEESQVKGRPLAEAAEHLMSLIKH